MEEKPSKSSSSPIKEPDEGIGTMKLRHVALICRSEEKADWFYQRLLGLKKLERKTLSAELSQILFNINDPLTVLHYVSDALHFEIFILDGHGAPISPIAHVCLEVSDLDAFLKQCKTMNIPLLRAPKGNDWITFIRDDDGNLFEIKETQA